MTSKSLIISTQSIRRYYEQNTRLFLSLGSSPRAYTIHRAVWMEGLGFLQKQP